MNIINLITIVQWCLGVLGLGLYCGIEQAEGWQILINVVLTLTTGITIWMLEKVKEVINRVVKNVVAVIVSVQDFI